MSSEEYCPTSSQGKHNIANDTEMPKPFMYLEWEGLETIQQKLDVHNSMTMAEYIHASLSLLRDHDAYNHSDWDHIFDHVHAVSTDVWPGHGPLLGAGPSLYGTASLRANVNGPTRSLSRRHG